MGAYILRRLLLIIPTLFGIMVLNFVIIHAAPGGPVEKVLARIKGADVMATARIAGTRARRCPAIRNRTWCKCDSSTQLRTWAWPGMISP